MEAPLRFRLRGIEEGVSRRAFEVSTADLDLTSSADLEYVGPVRLDVELARSGDQLQIRGGVRVAVRQRCVRCLEPVDSEVQGALSVVARRPDPGESTEDPPEGMLYHDSESFDLGGEVRELILIEVPAYPLCRPDCAGLCPRCGADRNAGLCPCRETVPGDPRLAALRALRETPPER